MAQCPGPSARPWRPPFPRTPASTTSGPKRGCGLWSGRLKALDEANGWELGQGTQVGRRRSPGRMRSASGAAASTRPSGHRSARATSCASGRTGRPSGRVLSATASSVSPVPSERGSRPSCPRRAACWPSLRAARQRTIVSPSSTRRRCAGFSDSTGKSRPLRSSWTSTATRSTASPHSGPSGRRGAAGSCGSRRASNAGSGSNCESIKPSARQAGVAEAVGGRARRRLHRRTFAHWDAGVDRPPDAAGVGHGVDRRPFLGPAHLHLQLPTAAVLEGVSPLHHRAPGNDGPSPRRRGRDGRRRTRRRRSVGSARRPSSRPNSRRLTSTASTVPNSEVTIRPSAPGPSVTIRSPAR